MQDSEHPPKQLSLQPEEQLEPQKNTGLLWPRIYYLH